MDSQFLKISGEYVKWCSSVSQNEFYLKQSGGKGSNRTEVTKRVILHDLLDDLFLKCSYIKNKVNSISQQNNYTEQQLQELLSETPANVEFDNCIVSMDLARYVITMSESKLRTLLKLNRKTSTWDNLDYRPRAYMRVPDIVDALKRIVEMSIVSIQLPNSTTHTVQSIITKVNYSPVDNEVSFVLDKQGVDTLSPDNLYRCKYIADSFVLSSEYCKNLHSYISYYADVIEAGRWRNGNPYTYTSVGYLADAMGVRFSDTLRGYDSKTSTYSRNGIVQMLKTYVSEINQKTRVKQIYGELCYDIERSKENSRGKVVGFKFYFKKEAN